jgi:translation initiation factor 1A
VILKYTTDEARILKNEGQLPESAKLNEGDEVNEGEVEFVDFGDEAEEDDEVAAQDRIYDISSSEDSDESDSDEDEDAPAKEDRKGR